MTIYRSLYKGKIIKTANPTGGKAGKGFNKTSTIQVLEPSGDMLTLVKQIRYKVGDSASLETAIKKARDFIDGKKTDTRGGSRPGSGMKEGQKKSKKLEEGEFTPLYLDKPTRDIFSDLGAGDRSKGARRAAKIAQKLAGSPFKQEPGIVCPGCGELKVEELIHCTNCGTYLPRRN